MAGNIPEAGTECTLETVHGSTVNVRIESDVWVNSKGIEGFDVTLLEDFGRKDAGTRHCCQTHIFEVVDA